MISWALIRVSLFQYRPGKLDVLLCSQPKAILQPANSTTLTAGNVIGQYAYVSYPVILSLWVDLMRYGSAERTLGSLSTEDWSWPGPPWNGISCTLCASSALLAGVARLSLFCNATTLQVSLSCEMTLMPQNYCSLFTGIDYSVLRIS